MKVKCNICGREFETLCSHMHRTHGITIEEYLEQFPGSATISDEYKEKQSKAMHKRNCNKEFSEHISERNRRNWENKEYRETQVLMMIKKRNSAVKGKHFSNKCISFVAYKSDFELAYAKLLDKDDSVESYDSESLVIWYTHNGEDKMYIPDFVVKYKDGRTEIIEIKPKEHHTAHDDLLKDKFEAAQQYCREHHYRFSVVIG